jgi:integrase
MAAEHGGATARDRPKGRSLLHAQPPMLLEKSGLGIEFRGHDLRRTASTNMAATGVPRSHISCVLNHIEGGPRATKLYDRYAYDSEKRIALETWSRVLSGIFSQKDGGTVVSFQRGA